MVEYSTARAYQLEPFRRQHNQSESHHEQDYVAQPPEALKVYQQSPSQNDTKPESAGTKSEQKLVDTFIVDQDIHLLDKFVEREVAKDASRQQEKLAVHTFKLKSKNHFARSQQLGKVRPQTTQSINVLYIQKASLPDIRKHLKSKGIPVRGSIDPSKAGK